MKSKEDFSHEEWILLGLAGAFNTEQDRWNLRKDEGFWQVTRETDEVFPNDIEVKAQFKTNGEAHDARASMSDIAAAKAFIAELSRLLEE